MRFMLLIYSSEDSWAEHAREDCFRESVRIANELKAEGKLLTTSPLHPVSLGTSVRVREGKRLITDGPFAETVEQLGGFYLLDVDDLDEAIGIAARLPPSKNGTVEIRPLIELPDLM